MSTREIIEGAQAQIKEKYQYTFHEETLEILDPEHYTWVAQVTITHNAKRGKPESTFFLLAVYTDFVLFEKSALPALTDWCLKISATPRKPPQEPLEGISGI